jgi:protein O-mannosyl-transferase
VSATIESRVDEESANVANGGVSTRLVVGMVLLLIAIVGHSHVDSFSVPFHFDDHRNITEGRPVLAYAEDGDVSGILRSNRPFGLWTLALNYKWHGLRVWGYHLVNFIVHLLSTGLVFWLSHWAIKRRGGGIFAIPGLQVWLAWSIALLWGTHPLASQPVIYIVQRFELLAAFFTLISIASYSLAAEGKRWPIVILAMSAWLGLWSKEPAAMLPILLILWDRTFCSIGSGPAIRSYRLAGLVTSVLPWLWFLPSVSRWLIPATKTGGLSKSPSMGFGMELISWWDYLRTQPEVIVHYIRLAIWPDDLCFDYGWQVQANPAIYWPLVMLFALIFVAGCFLWWRRTIAGFLILAFFVYLAPSSSLIPIADLAVEHRMYLPLLPLIVGAVAGSTRLTFGWVKVSNKDAGLVPQPLGLLLAVAMFLVVAGYGWRTRERCNIYQSPLLLWQDTLAKRPENARAIHNVGRGLLNHQKAPAAALPYLQRAATNWPIHSQWWFNLAECQRQLSMNEDALVSASRALHLEPRMGRAYNLIGIIHLEKNEIQSATDAFKTAIEFGEKVARYNLASIYVQQRESTAAIDELTVLISEIPTFKSAYRRLAWILATTPDDQLRDGLRAIEMLEQDFEIASSQNAYAWDAYAAALAEADQFDKAISAAERALLHAQESGHQKLADGIEKRLASYKEGRPHRDDGSDQDGETKPGDSE